MHRITGLAAALLACGLELLSAQPASAASPTLDAVRKRGELVCGVNGLLPGFSAPNAAKQWEGLDVDYCRAIAAAVLGDATKVKYVPLTAEKRFDALVAGEVDVLLRNSTYNLERATGGKIRFAAVNFYDGQGFVIPKGRKMDRAIELGPNCALAWTMRGLTCGYLGDAAEAIRCGEQALRLTPSDPFAFFHEAMLAQNLYFAGQRNAAIALGRKVLARCPSFTSNLRLLAVAHSATGEMTEAGQMLDLLLAAEPNFNLTSFETRTVLPPTQRAEYIARMRAAGAPT